MGSTGQRLKWDISVPKPDESVPGSAHDRWMRGIGLLLLGFVIPRLALIFDKFFWREADYWLGTAWYLAVAWIIWEGNRALALWLRPRLDWLEQPVWKVAILAAATVAVTVPLTIGAVWLWLRYIHSPYPALDWLGTIRTITTHNTITVVFLLHAYETLYLIRERHSDHRRLGELERARLAAELASLKGQLAPHFLFNCLNTLAALIERDPRTAAEFNAHLADVTRYLLTQQTRDLVPLREELGFLRSYVRLMELRFPKSLLVKIPEDPAGPAQIPPASLQLLIENAIKHNRHSESEPLVISIEIEPGAISVAHPHRAKNTGQNGTGTGLANLNERIALLTGQQIDVNTANGEFRVRLPLVTG